MAEKKVIIIGAGLAGLATGIYARMNGYQAHIFEHSNQPGGVCATWKRRGYTIDGGIHFYMGYRPGQPVNDLYRELGIDQPDQYQQITTYGRYLDPANDRMLDLTSDLDRFAADLKTISPADVATPYTYYRYTFNRNGAYEGFAITPAAIRAKIYRTLPGLSNFYMAGQWVSPGGGVIPSLMTGKHAVMLLCRQDGKKFETTISDPLL